MSEQTPHERLVQELGEDFHATIQRAVLPAVGSAMAEVMRKLPDEFAARIAEELVIPIEVVREIVPAMADKLDALAEKYRRKNQEDLGQ